MNVAVINIATILAILSLTQTYCEAQDAPKAASTTEPRCDTTNDCTNRDKICYENKCICSKKKPIEFEDECLPQALLGEECQITDQCLANSECYDAKCVCRVKDVAVYNPSNKLNYCLPYRRLEEECNSDLQCPLNSFCTVTGCQCLNGYGPQNVSSDGVETTECLPKTCRSGNDCDVYHECDDNKCKCVPTHFDINRARCYQFVDKLSSGNDQNSSSTATNSDNHPGDFISTLKDLTSIASDKLWLVLIVIITLSLILLILILSLLRKHYLGYCWTAHKKEYEPNTAKQQAPKSNPFDKNSINNKSFRRRNGELDDDDDVAGNDCSNEDKSNLVSKKSQGDFVAVNLNVNGQENESSDEQTRLKHHHHHHHHHHQQQGPLKSSTSTPV